MLRKKKMQNSKWFIDIHVIREEGFSLKHRTPCIRDCKELMDLSVDTVQWLKTPP